MLSYTRASEPRWTSPGLGRGYGARPLHSPHKAHEPMPRRPSRQPTRMTTGVEKLAESLTHNVQTLHPTRISRGLTVAVAVPNEVVRLGLVSMLTTLPSVDELIEVDDLGDLRPQFNHRSIDMIVLPCPSEENLEINQMVEDAADRGCKVLFLLNTMDQQDVSRAAKLPVDGFIVQTELNRNSLHETLQRIMKGEISIPSALARELLSNVRRRPEQPGRPVLLTPREQQALVLLADGLSNKQIARRLGISEHGAKRHVANVLAKLNSPNRTLAVVIALKEGLLSELGKNR